MENAVIETERFYMRPFMLDDAEQMYLLNLDPEVIRYTGDAAFKSVEEAYTFLQKYNPYAIDGYGRWTCVLKETGEVTGWCGLRMQADIGMVDLGYRFFKRHWGKGFATETSLASIAYGFNEYKLGIIIARAMKANTASVRVMEKCGMEYWKDDEDGDAMYRIINPEK
jgi:ribosomal-protein-alanine N-acetyltransferase